MPNYLNPRTHVLTIAKADDCVHRAMARYLSFMKELKSLLINSYPNGQDYLYGEPYDSPVLWIPLKDRVTLSVFAVNFATAPIDNPFVMFTRADLSDPPRKWTFSLEDAIYLELQASALSQRKGRKRGLFVPNNNGKPDISDGSRMLIRIPHD